MFDPVERYSKDMVHSQAKKILQSDYFSSLLKEIPDILLIVNHARQIIYLNKNLLENLNVMSCSDKYGLRPGEMLECTHAVHAENGCGSTDFCSVCGLANAIRESENGKRSSKECRLLLNSGEAVSLIVSSMPFKFEDETFIFCAIQDVSKFKTLEILERIFLHDISNTATTLYALGMMVGDLSDDELNDQIVSHSQRLIEEIRSYKIMIEAERNELNTIVTEIDPGKILNNSINNLKVIDQFKNKAVKLDCSPGKIFSDKILFRRVIINLLKNAMEASDDDEIIEVVSRKTEDGGIAIKVCNNAVIPDEVQLQMFQKAYSTKGRGRGWGTYSIKLLTEKYLKGEVTFSSSPSKGTQFMIKIPPLK